VCACVYYPCEAAHTLKNPAAFASLARRQEVRRSHTAAAADLAARARQDATARRLESNCEGGGEKQGGRQTHRLFVKLTCMTIPQVASCPSFRLVYTLRERDRLHAY